MSTWGSRIANELRPSSLTDSAITQREAGGLSTVIELPASEEPKKKASRLAEPAWTAAE